MIGTGDAHGVGENGDAGLAGVTAHREPGAQGLDTALGRVHQKRAGRPARVRRGLHQNFAVMEADQPVARVVVGVHVGAGVEHQLAAVGQHQLALLADAGDVLGAPPLPGRQLPGQRAQGRGHGDHAEPRQHLTPGQRGALQRRRRQPARHPLQAVLHALHFAPGQPVLRCVGKPLLPATLIGRGHVGSVQHRVPAGRVANGVLERFPDALPCGHCRPCSSRYRQQCSMALAISPLMVRRETPS